MPRIIPITEIGAPHRAKKEPHRLKTPSTREAYARTERLLPEAVFAAAAATSAKDTGAGVTGSAPVAGLDGSAVWAPGSA
jgi:hypothetical protein